jgi:hypothetical protein
VLLQSAEHLLDGRLLLLRVAAIVFAEGPMTITCSFSFDSQEGSVCASVGVSMGAVSQADSARRVFRLPLTDLGKSVGQAPEHARSDRRITVDGQLRISRDREREDRGIVKAKIGRW